MTRPESAPPRWLVIGVGNPYRHDDAVGRYVARELASACPVEVEVQEQSGDAFQLMESWSAAAAVVVIDALGSGAPPGTIRRIDVGDAPIPAVFVSCSTHAFGVAEAIELSRTLGQLPKRLVLFGIEARDLDPGVGLSPEVQRAASELLATIKSLVEAPPCP